MYKGEKVAVGFIPIGTGMFFLQKDKMYLVPTFKARNLFALLHYRDRDVAPTKGRMQFAPTI